ncbi:MAG: hypothetical protein ACRCU3_07875 [Eubacteriaceae bacterium]
MKLKPNQTILITLIIFVVGIGISIALGFWNTQTDKIPVRFSSGENAGEYNPSDIRGSYTFNDISVLFAIPVEDLGTAFGVTENIETFQCKSLESMYENSPVEIGTGSVKLFVSSYKGWEIDPGDSYVLEAGKDIILKNGTPTPTQIDYLNTHFLSAKDTVAGAVPTQKTEGSTEGSKDGSGLGTGDGSGSGSANPDKLIKGKTTFAEAISLGVPPEKIESIIGGPIPDMEMTIKDYCNSNGLDFSVISLDLVN